jgi:hypothetical protein
MAQALLSFPRLRRPVRVRPGRVWYVETALAALLVILAWKVAAGYVRADLLIWGDHPGQFMRLWYPLTHLGRVVDWNPTWYAGYPELQFYPPGAVLLGLGLHFLTLGLPSPELLYNLIPAVAFALPLFACYAYLRVALRPLGRTPSRVAGLAAGLLALTFTPMWGGIDAVVIGMMGERLAFGVALLVLLAGWRLVEQPTRPRLAVATALLAALFLLHPFHAPAPTAAVCLYALCLHLCRRHKRVAGIPLGRTGLWLGGWLLLAFGLVAWWLIPLLRHYTPYAAAMVRATPDQVISWFDAGPVRHLWLAALPALLLLERSRPRLRATILTLGLLPALILGSILVNHWLLADRLGWTMLDPIRFVAEYYLILILLAGSVIGAVTHRALWQRAPLGLAVLLLTGPALQELAPKAWRDVSDRAAAPASFFRAGLLAHPAFQGVWEALADDPTSGRVLFVSHYQHVTWPDGRRIPTTITSMTPYLAGREIVGGTFSHWSPVARWLWVGDPWARILPERVELEDNRRIFGIPWEHLDDAELAARLRALHVTVVVAGPADDKARLLFDQSAYFSRAWSNEAFTLYHLTGAPGDWIETQGAMARLVERSPRRWVVAVEQAAPGARMALKLTHYPLWRAAANGRPLLTRTNALGLQEVDLPAGAGYHLELSYREGLIEWSSLLLSLGAFALAGWLLRPKRRSIAPAVPAAEQGL